MADRDAGEASVGPNGRSYLSRLERGIRTSGLNFWILLSILWLGVVILSACFGPELAPRDPSGLDVRIRLREPTWAWDAGALSAPLGTDHLGRDVLSRLLVGARVSMVVGSLGVVVAMVVGVAAGLGAGFWGGWVDTIIMRVGDMQLALPMILLAIIVIGVLGPSLTNMVVVLALTSWVGYARLVRAEVLRLKGRQFVEAARALGESDVGILVRHILPNTLGVVIALAALDLGRMVFFESALSFLGLGLPPPSVSWGGMLAEGKLYLGSAWWLAMFPGLCITLTVLAASFIGDWLHYLAGPRRGG